MTLDQLKKAVDTLLEQNIEGDEPVCIEIDGKCYEANSITVVIHSDIWVPETVVVTATLIDETGEADDG